MFSSIKQMKWKMENVMKSFDTQNDISSSFIRRRKHQNQIDINQMIPINKMKLRTMGVIEQWKMNCLTFDKRQNNHLEIQLNTEIKTYTMKQNPWNVDGWITNSDGTWKLWELESHIFDKNKKWKNTINNKHWKLQLN